MVCEATNHYFDHVANMHVDQTNAVLMNALYKIGHDPDDSKYSFTRSQNPDIGRKEIVINAPDAIVFSV